MNVLDDIFRVNYDIKSLNYCCFIGEFIHSKMHFLSMKYYLLLADG